MFSFLSKVTEAPKGKIKVTVTEIETVGFDDKRITIEGEGIKGVLVITNAALFEKYQKGQTLEL